ncbi:MAG: flagellar type III secretion system pore protein FliP [Bryobacterales bacterium]|nr:flagellar type III secretion system pore protein FliP [Bryobacterales bacterium]
MIPTQMVAALLGQALVGETTRGVGQPTSNTPLQILFFLTAATVLPAVVVSLTPFLRITLVLHFLRQALGTQSAPSNQVLIGTALFLTTIVMKPIAGEVYERSWVPFEKGELSWQAAAGEAAEPMKRFWIPYCREKDLQLMIELTRTQPPARADMLSPTVIAPAYVISELRAGFQMGAVLFLPFLIIDLVVASVTLTIGMVQLPPVMISAPFKILLFVLADGWNLVIGSLVRSFQISGGV